MEKVWRCIYGLNLLMVPVKVSCQKTDTLITRDYLKSLVLHFQKCPPLAMWLSTSTPRCTCLDILNYLDVWHDVFVDVIDKTINVFTI